MATGGADISAPPPLSDHPARGPRCGGRPESPGRLRPRRAPGAGGGPHPPPTEPPIAVREAATARRVRWRRFEATGILTGRLRGLLAAVVVLAAATPRAARAVCNAGGGCPDVVATCCGSTSCTLDGTIAVTDDVCVLNFGSRDVTLSG